MEKTVCLNREQNNILKFWKATDIDNIQIWRIVRNNYLFVYPVSRGLFFLQQVYI